MIDIHTQQNSHDRLTPSALHLFENFRSLKQGLRHQRFVANVVTQNAPHQVFEFAHVRLGHVIRLQGKQRSS
jgi:hypothetical protein